MCENAGGLEPETARHRGLGQVAEGAEEADVAPVPQLRGGLADQHRDEGGLARSRSGPTRPTFSPAPTTKEASERRVRSPISMVRPDPTITTHCTGRNNTWVHSANGCSRPQVVDPDRRLHGDLHAPARHHCRERGAARHPALAQLELLGPAVGRRRLLADLGRLPPDRRCRGRHLRPAQDLRRRPRRLLGLVAASAASRPHR